MPHPSPSALPARRRWRLRWTLFAGIVIACIAAYRYTGVATPVPGVAGAKSGINPAIYLSLNRDEQLYRTAVSLAASADTPDERTDAAQAQHLSNELLDISFTVALERAAISAPAGTRADKSAQARVEQARQAVTEDQVRITHASVGGSAKPQIFLDVAKAQLALDQARLADAANDAARSDTSGSDRLEQLQQEHNAIQASPPGPGSGPTTTASNPDTTRGLMGELHAAWLLTGKIHNLLQARAHAQAAVPSILAEHDRLHTRLATEEAAINAARATDAGNAATLNHIQVLAREQQQISRLDQQADLAAELADTYDRWTPIAWDQRTVALHQALRGIIAILVLIGLLTAFIEVIERVFAHARWERKRATTLRHVLGVAAEALAGLCMLMVFFGQPTQLLTILGLAGAALTVAFQDAILSMAGWFVLMGRTGVHLGDWVEINGVVGEVIEIRLLKTVVLETGNWITAGHPTGRRVFFPNSFALKGSYFNYSTVGQWLWDELAVQIPAGLNPHQAVTQTTEAIQHELGPQVERAQHEWQHLDGPAPFPTGPTVQLRPNGGGFDLVVRYTTPAQERTANRERLWAAIITTLEKLATEKPVAGALTAGAGATTAAPA